MVDLPYTEAVLSLGESVTQPDRNALRALTRDATIALLKEDLAKEEELPKVGRFSSPHSQDELSTQFNR